MLILFVSLFFLLSLSAAEEYARKTKQIETQAHMDCNSRRQPDHNWTPVVSEVCCTY